MKNRQRVSLYLEEEGQTALKAIKAHYGMSSNTAAMRRALLEHARAIKEPPATIERGHVTYSRRVH